MRGRIVAQVLSISVTVSTIAVFATPSSANGYNAEGEQQTTSWIGERRSSKGLSGLTVDPQLVEVARRHAERMVERSEVYHNYNLMNETSGYSRLGENVGVGFSVDSLNQGFWASDSHRRNILGGWSHVGIGMIETEEGEHFAVQVFGTRAKPVAAKPVAAEPAKQKSTAKPKSSQPKQQTVTQPSQPKSKAKTPQPKPQQESSRAPASTPPSEDTTNDARPATQPTPTPRATPSGPTPQPPAAEARQRGYLVDQRRPIKTA